MRRNAIIAGGIILTLSLVGSGVFLWQKSQADVQALNKTLPEGVRITKSLFGNEYRVVNKIDGYEFGVSKMIGKIWSISYDSLARNKYWDTRLLSDGLQKLVENETALLVAGQKGEISDFKIERFAFKEDVPLKKFVEDLKSTTTSDFFDWFQIKINIIENNLTINDRDSIKLSVNAEAKQDILDISDYLYIFKHQSNIYILFLSKDDYTTQQFAEEIIANGTW